MQGIFTTSEPYLLSTRALIFFLLLFFSPLLSLLSFLSFSSFFSFSLLLPLLLVSRRTHDFFFYALLIFATAQQRRRRAGTAVAVGKEILSTRTLLEDSLVANLSVHCVRLIDCLSQNNVATLYVYLLRNFIKIAYDMKNIVRLVNEQGML